MKIAVLANDEQWKELMDAIVTTDIVRIDSLQDDTADAYILLDSIDNDAVLKLKKPVLLNSVIYTLMELKTSSNVLRINGWNGFLQRKIWEVAGTIADASYCNKSCFISNRYVLFFKCSKEHLHFIQN